MQFGKRKTAAHESGVTLWEMLSSVRAHKIGAQYDTDDLQVDVKEIYQRLGKPT